MVLPIRLKKATPYKYKMVFFSRKFFGTSILEGSMVSQGVTRCHRVSQGVTGSHRVSQPISGEAKIFIGAILNGLYWDQVPGICKVSQGVTRCQKVSQGVTKSL